MVQAHDIEALVDRIAERFKPDRIILFGSYAYGTPTEDSDVDLMVVRRYRGPHPGARVRQVIDVTFPLDILVRSPNEIKHRLKIGDYFIMDIVEQGIVLH